MEKTFRERSLTMAMRRRVLRWAAVTAVLCAAPLPAQAEEPDTDTAAIEEAKALFQQARAALKQGDMAQALVWLRKSYRRHQSSGTLLNMASCEEQLGFTASAWLHYRELTVKLAADDERLSFAKVRLIVLTPRVPRLQIKLAAAAPSGTRVTQDNVELKRADLGVVSPIDPIAHVIIVTAPGHKDRRYEVTVAEGHQEALFIEPGQPFASITPTKLTPTPPSGNPARTAGWIIGSAGLAGIGISAATGLIALSQKSEVERTCPMREQCTAEATGSDLATASEVAFVMGLAALGLGTYLVLTNRETPTATATLAPFISPTSVGLGATVAF